MTGTFIFFLKISKNMYFDKREIWIYIFSFLFISAYFISMFVDLNRNSIYMTIQVALIIFYFLWTSFNPYEIINLKFCYNLIIIFIMIHFLWWSIEGFNIPFSGALNNPNPFGGFMASLLGLFLIVKNNYIHARKITIQFVTVLALCLIYASDSRTSWLMILSFYVTYYFWPIVTKKKIIYHNYFIIILLIIVAITFLYPKLLYSDIGYTLQDISRSYTGKNFFSGRQVLWGGLLKVISESPLIGYGSAARPSEFLGGSLSAHNYYLQMMLQVGIIGTVFFGLLLFSIWKYLYIAKNNKSVRTVGALFIGILLYQVFEVSFTQNNLSISVIQWLIIGVGVHFARIRDNEKECELNVPSFKENT
ncbi:O-antigen ligase family protein [Paenibacillus sp. HB172176]|uniref:O-antigen ligase family protein n=1 Tax=Paenibacillus sp. HB172176 TaxID=2493690 RepID=UPI00143BB3AD|nr:O-antigen ligase family protein [Paenibacillus sp. HB172176]